MSNAFPNDLSRLDRLDGLGDPVEVEHARQFPPRRAIDVLREQEAQMQREGRRVFYAAVGVLISVLGLLATVIVGAL